MANTSFRRDRGPVPALYRTPSPPYHFVESLSPHLPSRSTTNDLKAVFPTTHRSRHNGASEKERLSKRRDGQKKSVMDTFASIALSANPSSSRLPARQQSGWNGLQNSQSADSLDNRPSKRARSEKLPSPNLQRAHLRPSTSYAPTTDAEAELLLNFSRTASLALPRHGSFGQQDAPTVHWLSPQIQHEQPFSSPVQNDHPVKEQSEKLERDGGSKTDVQRPEMTSSAGSGELEHIAVHGYEMGHKIQGENIGLGIHTEPSVQHEESENQANNTQTSRELPPPSQLTSPVGTSRRQSITMRGKEDNKPGLEPYVTSVLMDIQSENANNNPELQSPTSPQGIEEAARATSPKQSNGTLEIPPKEKISIPSSNVQTHKTSSTKAHQAEPPSICAACNFHKNTLTQSTENDATSWINCDGCKSWFHFACAGFKNEREVRAVDKYRCKKCKPVHGSTTFVRKSARAHSAIDYAGLNEGVLKTSDESPEHHYIKPIKEGTIKFNPEKYARMHPELVTRDYFERGDGFKEPVVIPAAFNPRPRSIPNPQVPEDEEEDLSEESLNALHDQSVLEQWLSEDFEYETVLDEGQDSLDMVIPQGLTVRKVGELYGLDEKIEVIDVKTQNGEEKRWDMRRWVDYYESMEDKVVRNVISLEVSQTKLGRLIRRPKVVRDLDLQDAVWPQDLVAKGDFPKVQFYCLMSVADCYTDFHIDFGGSSVFYHILKGKKTFFFIPPHEKNLKKYEEWCLSPAQNWTFLGDQTKECYRVDLSEGDTMLIPAGWIHAVWTPEDSLVIGGNFLTHLNYDMQIRIAQIEKATGVARKFRYPQFQKLLWYAALKYLEEDPLPATIAESLLSGQVFERNIPTYLEFETHGEKSNSGPENYHTRYYSQAELDGLPSLARYLQRTALIAMGNITEGISVETRNAVKRSIPKGHGEPLDLVKKFALWYTWKRGNEPIPHWAYPDHVPEAKAPELTEKKLSAKALKRLEREAAFRAWRVVPERESSRRVSKPATIPSGVTNGTGSGSTSKANTPAPYSENSGSSKKNENVVGVENSIETVSPVKKPRTSSGTNQAIHRRPACETCRKRRRACKHRDDPAVPIVDPIPDETLTKSIEGGPQFNEPEPKEEEASHSIGDEVSNSYTIPALPNGLVEGTEVPVFESSIDPSASPTQARTGTGKEAAASISSLGPLAKPIGRSKACADCRRSKRRCIHDENGKEDPIKIEQAIIPRPSASKKRKINGEGVEKPAGSKAKKSLSMVEVSPVQPQNVSHDPFIDPTLDPQLFADQTTLGNADINSGSRPANESSLETIPDGVLTQRIDSEVNGDDQNSIHTVLPSAEDEVHLVATSPNSNMKYENEMEITSISNTIDFAHKDGASSLVSPPESTHTDVDERSPPSRMNVRDMTPPATVYSSRQSSHPEKQPSTATRFTPESGPARRASVLSNNRRASTISLEGGSTGMAERISASPGMSINGGGSRRSKSRMNSEIEADPESLKLIRELQAQDMGLRRRARV